MVSEEKELRDFQKWMQTFIVAPGTDQEALSAAEKTAGFEPGSMERLVLPCETLEPMGRMLIYRNQYLLRMKDALEADYPGLRHYLGGERFFELVEGYVEAHPSRSYTLNRLGDHLVGFIGDCSLFHGDEGGFLQDLARLEYGLVQIFEAPSSPVLTGEQVAALDPELWAEASLEPVEAFRLMTFDYPANDYVRSMRAEDADTPAVGRRKNCIVLWRDGDYTLWRLELNRPRFDFLSALAEGTALGQAVARLLEAHPEVEPQQPFQWFGAWISEQMFSRLATPRNDSCSSPRSR